MNTTIVSTIMTSTLPDLSASLISIPLYSAIYILHSIYAVILFFVLYLISLIISLIVGWVLYFTCHRRIYDGERRKELLALTHSDFVRRAPYQLLGWSKNRVLFWQLVVSWVVFLYGLYGIFVAEKIYAVIITTGFGAVFLVWAYRSPTMSWVSSFIARFVIFYYDIIRVRDFVTINNRKCIVVDINAFTTKIRCLDTKLDDVPKENFTMKKWMSNNSGIMIDITKNELRFDKVGYCVIQNIKFTQGNGTVIFWWKSELNEKKNQ